MSLDGPYQSQKEDEWDELMGHIKEFADNWGYTEWEVTEILTNDLKFKPAEFETKEIKGDI